jgi:CheY-like chemotaxis protein
MDSASNERIKLALKVLSARYDRTVTVSESEMEALKSYLPADVVGLSTDDMAGQVIQKEVKEFKARREKSERAKTILVIDDDAAFLAQLTQVLKDAGYNVLAGTDLANGMAVLERLHADIDLTVVDLVLPGGSGFELINAASRRPNPMKILATTGLLKPNYLEVAKYMGAHDVIRKPAAGTVFPANEWLQRVGALLADQGERGS